MPTRWLGWLSVGVIASAISSGLNAQDTGDIRQSGAPLFTALLTGEDPPDEALDNLPPDARQVVGAALARARRYRPRIAVPPDGEWFETSLAEQRQRLERALVSLTGGVSVEKEAIEYASHALLAYEWEGFSDPPLGEAAHTEEFLQRNPQSVLRPSLELFQLHRYRCAFEAAGFEGNAESRRIAAAKYVTLWKRVSASKNLAVQAIAHELDSSDFLYIANQGHPSR
jgi:hypothetical protein